MQIECPLCGVLGEFDIDSNVCYYCGNNIQITIEESIIENKPNLCLTESLPVLENGTSVEVTNEEHPWFGEIGLICDKKPKFYRIEIMGSKVWFPVDWVKEYEHY